MTQSQRKKRTRTDLKIAAKVMPKEGATLLPAWATELWKPHRFKVVWGGRGGTRSWTYARTLLMMAARRKLRVLCAREMQSSLRDSVHQLLRDQIDLMGLQGYTVTDREIRHVNGSLFLFEGLRHNRTKIKSLEGIDICWVEEAERISKDSWSILIPTIRKAGSEIWVTFNPDQETDATYVRFILKPAKGVWSKKVGWEDNPWLSKELQEEKDYDYEVDPDNADWIWGGNIRKFSEAQILRGKYIVQEFTVPRSPDGTPLWDGPYQGQDFGFGADPAAAVRLWIHDDILYVEYEGWKLHLEIDETATQWNTDLPGFHLYTTRADSARPDTISFLRRHGLPRIRPAKKHAGSVADGIAHLRSYRQIIVHSRCTHFAQECKLYSYKVDALSGDVLPIIIDRHNHLIDSARYALDPLIKPMRQVGLDFVDEDKIALCPDCESRLPDDGECPHCGWVKPEEPIEMDPEELAVIQSRVRALTVPIEELEEVPRIDTRHTNGNGNGNGHKNGNGNGKHTMSRLLDLND